MLKGTFKHSDKAKRAISKTHSGAKHYNWKGGGVETNCGLCGKAIYTSPSKNKKGWGKFCSPMCHGKWDSQNRTGENSHMWKGGEVKINCKVCNKEKYVAPSVLKYGRGMFCSKKCQGIWVTPKGEKNRKWKGGEVFFTCRICGKKKNIAPSLIKYGCGKFCSHRCSAIYKNKHQKKHDTDIECLMEDELIRRNIPYTKQVPLLGIALVDFLLPHDIVIQCDGDYWHSRVINKGKDIAQDTVLYFKGYKIFRFKGSEIKKSAKKCIDKVFNKGGLT